jgi:hypothetical protein
LRVKGIEPTFPIRSGNNFRFYCRKCIAFDAIEPQALLEFMISKYLSVQCGVVVLVELARFRGYVIRDSLLVP